MEEGGAEAESPQAEAVEAEPTQAEEASPQESPVSAEAPAEPAAAEEEAVPAGASTAEQEESNPAATEVDATQIPPDGGQANVSMEETVGVSTDTADATAASAPGGECSVDFVILPEGYGQTKQMDIRLTIGKIRMELEQELSIPENSLFLMNMTGACEATDVLDDERALCEFGVNAGDKIGVELRINYFQEQDHEEYAMPDTLELKVRNARDEERIVTVHVQRPLAQKPYLGGFKNKHTKAEYHHAFTQSDPVGQKKQNVLRYHREAQTYEYRTRSTQCKRDKCTQMAKQGLYLSCEKDTYIEPRKPYFSSADKSALVLEKCVIIQCHARGMFARRRARQLRKARAERLELEMREAQRRRLESELRHKREIERRMHPRTFEDFSVLYKELESWRLNESKRINASNFDELTRHAAMRELLHKETKLLQTIDRLKIQAHHRNRDAKIKRSLESMAKPKVWAQSDGETTTVHTPFTTRAKELMDLYSGLRLPLLTVDERLDVLLHVKWTVKEFDCNLTRELVDLIDREADMLNRGRPEKSFAGLRKRMANLFLQFIETPEFNPEATRFQKVPRQLYDQTGTHPLSTVPIKGLGQI